MFISYYLFFYESDACPTQAGLPVVRQGIRQIEFNIIIGW